MEDRKPPRIRDIEKEERARQKKIEEKRKLMRNFKVKANIIRSVSICLILLLSTVVLYIKVVHGEEYEKQAVIQPTTQENEQILAAKRGDILDRTGKSLAVSASVYNVFVDIKVLNDQNEKSKNKDLIDKTANELYALIEYPVEDFKKLFAKNSDGTLVNNTNYYVIKKEISNTTATAIKDKKLTGIHLEELGKRVYPYNNIASQTIGFIGGDGKNSNWGLENYYDSELTGIDGRYFVSYDANNSVKKIEVEPIKGNTISTTLDATMQQFCDELVDKYGAQHGAKNAAIVIMKPDTGEIITMSEYPRFNNNFPGKLDYVSDPNFAKVDETLPDTEKGDHIYNLWKNFNVSDTFEPGSIFKPVTVAAALEENIISNNDVFFCNGYKTFPDGTRVKCWVYDSTGGGHGKQNVEEALANSCNVAMMEIGDKMGADVFSKYQQDFGFGVKTGIDLPGEEDAKNLVYGANELNEVELATGSFGQGFNSTTLQDLVAFNATINGGYIVKPYVVSDILDSIGKVVYHREPQVLRQVISKQTSDIVRKDLAGTVTYGTGKNLAINGYSIGGKTGTAEQIPRGSGKYAVSFVGYLPLNNPQYIALGVINEPNDYVTKHTSAVPMMKEVFEKLINYYNIQSDSASVATNSVDKVFIKDYTGDVVSAVADINSKGYNYEISGSGDRVYKQIPNKNQPIDANTTVILYVDASSEEVMSQMVEVPDLVGLDLNAAGKTLEELGFDVVASNGSSVDSMSSVSHAPAEKTAEKENSNIETKEDDIKEVEYTVIRQMPKKGISLPKNTQIRLIYK